MPIHHGMASCRISVIDRYEALIRKAIQFGYYKASEPGAQGLLEHADFNLFTNILQNTGHILYILLPANRNLLYSLRGSWHGRDIGDKDARHFVNRILYTNIY